MGLFNNLFNKSKPSDNLKPAENSRNRDFYFYTYGKGNMTLIEFDTVAANEESHHGYDTCLRIIIYINPENCISTGLPNKEENQKLSKIENELNSSLRADCRYVGKMTYGAMMEFIYQVNDVSNFMKSYSLWAKSLSGYKIELKESAGWEFFDTKVKPSSIHQHQISDRHVIDTLIENGSDPSKPHILEHLFIGDKEKLTFLSEQLAKDGFDVGEITDGSLTVRKSSTLDLKLISELTMRFAGYCEKIGVKYDGWGTAIIS